MSVADPTVAALAGRAQTGRRFRRSARPWAAVASRAISGRSLFLLPGSDLAADHRRVPVHRDDLAQPLRRARGPTSSALGNYKAIFSTTDIIVSLKNNVVWVVVFPFLVTFFGSGVRSADRAHPLVDGVQDDRVHAARVQRDGRRSDLGVDLLQRSAHRHGQRRDSGGQQRDQPARAVPGRHNGGGERWRTRRHRRRSPVPAASLQSKTTVTAGGTIELGLTGISPSTLQANDATPAQEPTVLERSDHGPRVA